MVDVVEIYNQPGQNLPAWMRRAMIGDDGTVFVTPAIADVSEQAAFLCAGYDGVSVARYEGHVYLPAKWMRREYPRCADIVDVIEKVVAAAAPPET